MMRRLTACVRVRGEDGRQVVLTPADEVPAWAARQITNPAAWDTPPVAGADEEPVPATDDAEPDYESMTVADLRSLIEDRNDGRDEDDLLPDQGRKADLIAVLEADDE